MKKPYISFEVDGKSICAISVRGIGEGEIKDTLELLAYEKNISPDDIKIKIIQEKQKSYIEHN